MPLPHLEALASVFACARTVCILNMLRRHRRKPLSSAVQHLFIMMTFDGLYTPRRVRQGVFNTIAYIQQMMKDVPDGLVEK